jgi:hypothetical protein
MVHFLIIPLKLDANEHFEVLIIDLLNASLLILLFSLILHLSHHPTQR